MSNETLPRSKSGVSSVVVEIGCLVVGGAGGLLPCNCEKYINYYYLEIFFFQREYFNLYISLLRGLFKEYIYLYIHRRTLKVAYVYTEAYARIVIVSDLHYRFTYTFVSYKHSFNFSVQQAFGINGFTQSWNNI